MMPTDHFMQVNNRKCRAWGIDEEPRQCYVEQEDDVMGEADAEELAGLPSDI